MEGVQQSPDECLCLFDHLSLSLSRAPLSMKIGSAASTAAAASFFSHPAPPRCNTIRPHITSCHLFSYKMKTGGMLITESPRDKGPLLVWFNFIK